jgi:hypothetical protein
VNRFGLRARSVRPGFLESGARLGARARSDDKEERIDWEWAGGERRPLEAAGLQWKEDGAAAWDLEVRSSKPPLCFAPPPARDGENNLTFANASVMFSLSTIPKFIETL